MIAEKNGDPEGKYASLFGSFLREKVFPDATTKRCRVVLDGPDKKDRRHLNFLIAYPYISRNM